AAATALSLGAQAPAFADSGVQVGGLTCDESAGWGLVLASSHDLHCTYQSAAGDVERYEGTIDKLGVDIGYKAAGVMVWQVWAPSDHMRAGAVDGSYGGACVGA